MVSSNVGYAVHNVKTSLLKYTEHAKACLGLEGIAFTVEFV